MFPTEGTTFDIARFCHSGKGFAEGAPRLTMGHMAMDGRFWDGSAARHEGGNLHVKKEEPDREKMIAARARQRAIGRELRRMYDDVVQEPVPDDFLDLLKKIDESKGKKDASS
jgi:hypothetical protein